MGRKDSKTMQNIKVMYGTRKLDSDMIYHKTKILLSVYRDVIWQGLRTSEELYDSITNTYCSNDLNTALAYLIEFAPTENKQRFEARVSSLFETKWMVDLIDQAMFRVYEYHSNGKLYHEILSKSYLVSLRYTESELLETLAMERSVFYDKRKEAVMLFGIALWGYAIPQLKGVFGDIVTDEIPEFYR